MWAAVGAGGRMARGGPLAAGRARRRAWPERAPMDAGRCHPGGRLDMSHGFVRHIRRNQIARDDYDRQVKQAKEQLRRRLTPAPPRPRRPDQQVYRAGRRGAVGAAPGGGGGGGEGESEASSESSSSSRERRPRGPALFCLEYEADGGQVTSVVVYQDNDPEEVVEKVSAQNQLEPALHEALRQRVQDELEKRRVKR